MKTVAGIFQSSGEAEHVIHHLENMGIASDQIHLIAGNDPHRKDGYLREAEKEETTTASAAITGARIGGGIGILATVAALAIPGVGPIIAGGAMATVLAGLGVGAAAGGLLGALKNLGISHEEAHLYEEAVRRGSIFVAVQVSNELEPEVLRVMDEHGARDVRDEAEKWRADGWQHPYPNDSSIKWHDESEIPGESRTRARTYPYAKNAE